MKKKLLLIPILLIFVLVLTFSLVACNSATTQGLLANILNDHSKEVFVYDVFNSELNQSVGTYTVTLKSYAQGSSIENFGENFSLSNLNKGICVSGNLELNDGTKYSTACYFDIISGSSYMIPAYTYRKQVTSDSTFILSGYYEGSTLVYDKTVNGEKIVENGTLEASSTYYDNNEFHQSLRTITTFSTSLSFSFTVPLVTETEAACVSLTAACSKEETVTSDYNADGINCYVVNISRSTDVTGVNQTLYYATDNLNIKGWNIKNALIKIVEPFKKDNTQYNMVYTLKSVALE